MKSFTNLLKAIILTSLIFGLFTAVSAQSKTLLKVQDHTSIAQISGTSNGQNVTYFNPYTSSNQTTFAGTFTGTLNSQAQKFYCIDLAHYLEYNVDYWDEGTTPSEMTYILNNYFPYKTSYTGKLSDNNQEAAAIQMAIWHFGDGVNANTITDATIKNRALAIIADAVANHNNVTPAPTLKLIPPSQALPQGTVASFMVSAVDINNNPLAGVSITLSSTLGTLSTTSVVTGSNGQAGPITLTYSGIGIATVSAQASVIIPHGTKYVHKTNSAGKQKLVLATPSFDLKKVTGNIEWTACKNKIGSYVYRDKNANGTKDTGEPGIAGAVVELLQGSTVIATTTTDANGLYSFANLANGAYTVRLAASNFASGGVFFSTAQTKWYTKNATSVNTTLNCNDNLSINFGYYKTCVSLTKSADKQSAKPGDVIAYTFTIENCGDISLTGGVTVYDQMINPTSPYNIAYYSPVNPGETKTFTKTYTVKTTDCGNLVNNAKAVGHPSDGSAVVEFSTSATVAIDCKASLGDKVWEDLDRDGIQDTGEPGVPNITVKLYDCSNNLIATTTTDANGNYLFSNLNAGSYYVLFVKPAGYLFTIKDAGSNDAVDSDADITTGKTICTTLSIGENDLTWDAGLYKEGTLVRTIVTELCADNKQNVTYPVGTLTAYVYSNGDVKVKLEVSKALNDNTYGTNAIGWSGGHTFSNLTGSDKAQFQFKNANGNIVLEFNLDYITASSSFPSGYGSLGVSGGDGSMVSGNAANILSFNTSINKNFNDFNYVLTTNSPATDAGYTPNPTYPNWIFTMEYEATISGAAFGSSGFGEVSVPSMHHSPNKLGFDNAVIPYACPTKASLGDRVWKDLDKDGIQDTGEPGVPNITVKLYDCSNNLIATTTTDANGNYLFSNLNPGSYYVQFVLPSGFVFTTKDVGSNDAVDSDADVTNGKTICTTLTAGENDLTWDAGIYEECKNAVGSYVYRDKNANGTKDTGEPGIAGAVVELLQGSTVIATTTTDANGLYSFANLANGTYTVRLAASNFASGGVFFSTAQTKWYTKNATSVNTTLNCNDNLSINFGYYKTCVSLTKVANKQSANPGETITYTFTIENCGDIPLTGGVTVYDQMINPTSPYDIAYYSPVNPGETKTFTKTYVVKTTDCGNLVNNAKAIGHPSDGSAAVEFAASATVVINCKASLGDKVWKDLDKDGIQDTGEPGVPNITVKLYDCSNNLIATTTTDANGNYLFANLNPGSYYVQFILPSGFVFTTKDVGSNDAVDSDADVTNGKTICTTLTAGENDLTWDAGIYEECKNAVGSYVYRDKNANGTKDTGEPGIAGAVVELLQGSTVIATTTTDANGLYSFANLANGAYTVRLAASNFASGGVFFSTAQTKWYTKNATSVNTTLNCNDNLSINFGYYKTCVNIIKTSDKQSYNNGETITYSFTVENCGDIALSGGVDVFDAMLNPSGNHLIKHITLLSAGQSTTFTMTYTTGPNDCGQITNTAIAEGHPIDGSAYVTDESSWTVTVNCQQKADVKVEKTVDNANPNCNDYVNFTIKATNLGPNTATGVVVTDILPSGLIYISSTASQGTYNSTTGIWNVGSLASGAFATLTIKVKVDCGSINGAAFDLGAAKDFNLFVIEDANQPSSDTQGKVAVGRDASFSNYSIGDQLPPNSGDVLIVGRDLTYTSGAVYNGNVVYGHATNLPQYSVSISGGILRKDSPINFAAAKAYLENLSTTLGAYTVNGTTTFQWGGLTLTGSDPFLNVFAVSGASLSSANNLTINVPNGSVVLVNISGTTVSWTGGLVVNGTAISNVLYNFYQATSLTISGIDIRGSVLAPFAALNFITGVINGQMICKSLTGMGQFNYNPFGGHIPIDKKITNCATITSITMDPNPNNNSSSATITVNGTSGGNGGNGGNGGTNPLFTFGQGEIVYSLAYSGNTIYAGTWGGKIYKSTDGGKTWTVINGGMTVSFIWSLNISGGVLFAATEQGVFKYNGTTWTLTSLSGKDVHALTSFNGTLYAGTWGFGVFKSTNLGSTWTEINNGFNGFLAIQALTVNGSGHVFAGTAGGGVFKSTDGTNWNKLDCPYNIIWSLATTSSSLFVGTYGDGLYKSNDGGMSFTKVTSLSVAYVYSMAVDLSGKIYVSSLTNGVYVSSDNGSTWNSLGMGGFGVSAMIVNPNSNDVYVGTKAGQLYKINANYNATDVNDSISTPKEFKLAQNYPNPFNPSTTIEFVVPSSGIYSLRVYNVIGQEVANLIESELASGLHKVHFDASKLSSGMYIYKLTGSNVNLTRKMLLMK